MPNKQEIVFDFPIYNNDEYTLKIITEQESKDNYNTDIKYLQHNIVIMKHDSLDTIPYIWFRIDQMRNIIKQLQCYCDLIDSMEYADT